MAWIGTAGLFATLPLLWLSHAQRERTLASPVWPAAAAILLIVASLLLIGLAAG